MSNNKGYYNKEKSFITEPELKEEAPIEVAPEVIEEVKEEIKEIPEIRQEIKPAPKAREEYKPVSNERGKVILITRDGCVAENLNKPGDTRRLFGSDFLAKNLGDIVEF